MIGILGGSFDPVHAAHLAMADAFAQALSLDEVRFLPAGRPWQKGRLGASGAQRTAMLECMIAAHRPPRGRYVVDPREIDRTQTTYTVDTLADIRRDVGGRVPIVFLLGADQLVHLDSWHDWTHLWDCAHLAAATRPGFDVATIPSAVAAVWSQRLADADALRAAPAGHSFLLESFEHDVSATQIRAAFADGLRDDARLQQLVPPCVLDYIRANHLYRS